MNTESKPPSSEHVKDSHAGRSDLRTRQGPWNLKKEEPTSTPQSDITHVANDGSTSYFNSPLQGRTKEQAREDYSGYTTPGYEWASAKNGYDWESRKVFYGPGETLGDAYQQQMAARTKALNETYRAINADREKAISEQAARVKTTETRVIVADGYWAGTEA
jgi:hypothetical protein